MNNKKPLYKTHLKTGSRNGIITVLCKKSPDMIWKTTEKIEEIDCSHCLSRLKK